MLRDFLTGKPIPENRYQEYLLSAEWKAKCAAVRERCKGVCERCLRYLVDHVHHLTYERVFNEPLEELQGLCAPCHNFLHGKSGIDPLKESIWIKVTGKHMRFWDQKAGRFRRIEIAKLNNADKFRWVRFPGNTSMALDPSEWGEYRVPVEVFLDREGKPILDPSRWEQFRTASRIGRHWMEHSRRGRVVPDPSANDLVREAMERGELEEQRLREHPEKFTNYQNNLPTTFKELRALIRRFPRVVSYGVEYSIRHVRQTKRKGVVIDLERTTGKGWVRLKMQDIDRGLATGRLVLDRERGIWVSTNQRRLRIG